MAERRGSRRSPNEGRSPFIPEPSGDAITYRGERITPGMILRLWRSGQRMKRHSRARILQCRAMRRKESGSLVRLSSAWARNNPEAADWVVSVMPERLTLERDLIARVGVVEPEYQREPLGFLDTDISNAEACQSYLEEWRLRNVPTQAMFGKAVEDGEFGLVILPAYLDMDGAPTFFETLDERAYELLDKDKQSEYVEDDDARTRKRYVKTREKDGRRVKLVNPRFDKGSDEKSEEAHKDALRRYLLKQQAVNIKLVPALDCAPIFQRGTQRDRWVLSALVTRELFYPEELIEQEYGWKGMGDRKLVPLAYGADGSKMSIAPGEASQHGQLCLYTAYLVCRDKAGRKRPIVAYTVGGASTVLGGAEEPGDNDPESVGCIDFWDELKYTDENGRVCGLEGPLWSYHGGLHTEDDDPDHYWQPAQWPFCDLITQIEGNKTAINASTAINGFPGHWQEIDPKLAELAPEAVLETDGELRRPHVPRTGEVEPVTGPITPAVPAQVSADAWRQLAADTQSLRENTAVDQMPASGQSGHAQLVELQSGQTAKRHIREGVSDAVVSLGEKFLKIVDATYHCHDVRWPLQTTQERPVGEETREGRTPAEYDPAWVGDGNFNLECEYPEEENLARIDLERSLALDGFGNTDRVHKAMGEPDSERARLKADRDRLMKLPEIDLLRLERVAKKIGAKDLQEILKLRAQMQMSKAEAPGLEGGIPTASLNRQGTGGEGAGSTVAGIRGGIQGAQVGGDRLAADAQAAMTQSGTG